MAQLFGATPETAEMERRSHLDDLNPTTRDDPSHTFPKPSPSQSTRLSAKIKLRDLENAICLPPIQTYALLQMCPRAEEYVPYPTSICYEAIITEWRRDRLHNRAEHGEVAWSKLAPGERARFGIEAPDYTPWNLQIPLSPSVTSDDGPRIVPMTSNKIAAITSNDAERAVEYS